MSKRPTIGSSDLAKSWSNANPGRHPLDVLKPWTSDARDAALREALDIAEAVARRCGRADDVVDELRALLEGDDD